MRYDNGNATIHHDTIRYDTMRYDDATMLIRYGCDAKRCDMRSAIRIRYGNDATRYDTLVRDNDGSLSPDRVREPIKFKLSLNLSLIYLY